MSKRHPDRRHSSKNKDGDKNVPDAVDVEILLMKLIALLLSMK